MSAKYDELKKELEETYIKDELWKEINSGYITLLTGAGVTSCLVGNWNELLNELAIMRSVAGKSIADPQKMMDYLNLNCNGKFLPDDISTLEKGEYLRYSPTDQRIYDTVDKMAEWREKVFAGRVEGAIERLIRRHLCDGVGMHCVDDYKKDFLNWINNVKETPFDLERKILSKNKEVEVRLESLSKEQIADKINDSYKSSIQIDKLVDYVTINDAEQICEMFVGVFDTFPKRRLLNQIKTILGDEVLKGKTASDKAKAFLIKLAAFFVWRPGYETLEVLLSMCIYKKVQCVITYNFDTIFDRLLADTEVQEALCEKGSMHSFIIKNTLPLKVCVYGIKDPYPYSWTGFEPLDSRDALHIYHVHGVVDRELSKPEPIIFSETAYRSYQQLVLNQGSIQIANAYSRGNLICVGFSGVDPNFRSIIRQLTQRNSVWAYSEEKDKNKIFITRSLKEIRNQYHIDENMEELDLEMGFHCVRTFLDMMQHYFRHEVDVTILWSKDYEDMVENMKTAFKATTLVTS